MMAGSPVIVVIVCVLTIWPSSSFADPSECQDAVTEYKSAMSDISTALQSYTSCLSSTGGHDDCSTEFEQLKSAQDDFEDAVSKYETECN